MSVVIIGAGFAANYHVNALRAYGQNIDYVVTSNMESARKFAKENRIQNYTDNIENINLSEITHMHICTPPFLHADFIIKALDNNIKVLCEKPLITLKEDYEKIKEYLISYPDKNNLINIVQNVRFYDAVLKMKEIINSDDFGKIYSVSGNYMQEFHALPAIYDWRYDTSRESKMRAVTEIGTHFFDLVRFLTKDEIEILSATFLNANPKRILDGREMFAFCPNDDLNKNIYRNKPTPKIICVENEDAAAIIFKTKSNAIGNVFLSEIAHGRGNNLYIEIIGEKKSVWWNEEEFSKLYIGRKNKGVETLSFPFGTGFNDTYVRMIKDFYEDNTSNLATAIDGLQLYDICEDIYRLHTDLSNEYSFTKTMMT